MFRIIVCFVATLFLWSASTQAQFNSFPPGAFTGKAARDASGGGGGISVVQKTSNIGTNVTALTTTFGAGMTAGSIIVVACSAGNGAFTVSSVTDNNSDTSTDSGQGLVLTGTGNFGTFVRAFLAPTTGTTSVTATLSAQQGNFVCAIWEVAGLTSKVFDQVPTPVANVNTSASVTTSTLTSATEFALAFLVTTNGAITANLALSPGVSVSDFGLTLGATPNVFQAAHEITAATSALTSNSGTTNFSGNAIWAVTFK